MIYSMLQEIVNNNIDYFLRMWYHPRVKYKIKSFVFHFLLYFTKENTERRIAYGYCCLSKLQKKYLELGR